jgi:hypothetical protein
MYVGSNQENVMRRGAKFQRSFNACFTAEGETSYLCGTEADQVRRLVYLSENKYAVNNLYLVTNNPLTVNLLNLSSHCARNDCLVKNED